jgi:hypothetical protein
VFENRVLRKIFGPKRDEVTEECKKLLNEELNDLYYPTQFCVGDNIEKNKVRGACSGMGEERGVNGVLEGNLRERDHWGDPGVDGRIILRWIFRKMDVRGWTGLSWLRIETGGGHL